MGRKKKIVGSFSYSHLAGISKKTQDYMDIVIGELESKGRLNSTHIGALDMLASNYNIYIKCAEALANGESLVYENEKGCLSSNPLFGIMHRAGQQMIALCKQFGLTSLDEKRMERLDGHEKEDESPLAMLMQMDK
jgi:P27 family predicted phage terminase small subunit